MDLFNQLAQDNHEQIVVCSDKNSGLRAIIAIHSTTLGPALGGTRMWTYATDEEALRDALRLSKGMTYKNAIAGLNHGGGKAVIIGDSKKEKTELMFRAFGRFVDGLNGRYITAEDVGMDVRDMEFIRMETKYVTGVSVALGGSGDPSPVTAFGVYSGMKAAVHEVTGSDSLKGKKIAVQGAGHVASHLCRYLAKEGAKLFVTDIFEDKALALAKEVKAKFVKADDIYDVDADVFAPCALGAVLNDTTIPRLKCKVIAGGANNQLLDQDRHGRMLIDRNILYAPDYAINCGGVMNVGAELSGYDQARVMKQAEGIYDILKQVFTMAKREKIPTYEASNKIAEERIRRVGAIQHLYSGTSNLSGRLGELSAKGRA
jgi:leucine dehydrogenase